MPRIDGQTNVQPTVDYDLNNLPDVIVAPNGERYKKIVDENLNQPASTQLPIRPEPTLGERVEKIASTIVNSTAAKVIAAAVVIRALSFLEGYLLGKVNEHTSTPTGGQSDLGLLAAQAISGGVHDVRNELLQSIRA